MLEVQKALKEILGFLKNHLCIENQGSDAFVQFMTYSNVTAVLSELSCLQTQKRHRMLEGNILLLCQRAAGEEDVS